MRISDKPAEVRRETDDQRLREAIDALPIAIYATDAEGRITYYNEAAAELAGRRPELGRDSCVTWRLFRPDGTPLPHDQCPMAVALREQRPVRGVEAIAERPDGSRVRFMPFPTPLFDREGRLRGAVNLLLDTTERHQAEVEAAHVAAIVASADDAVVSKTLDGRVRSWNEGAKRLFGYQADEMIGQSITRIIPPELHGEEELILARLRQGERLEHFETVRLTKDGRRVHVSLTISPVRDKTGTIIGASKVARDITARRQAELESAHLAAIVASSDDAIISMTLDGRIRSWNDAATRIYGYEAGEMLGESITRIIPPELHGEEERILTTLRRGKPIGHYETVRITKDGRRVNISLTVSPVRDKAGRIIGASKVARDITERKRAEELQQLLIAELNHRVKNTLATVQSIANHTVRHAGGAADFVSSFSGRIHALAHAHDVLTQNSWRGADVQSLVRDQLLLGRAQDDRIAFSGPAVMLDPQPALHLALILHELGTNARKYGSLSVPNGRLSVQWTVRTNGDRTFLLQWQESGGPAVSVPTRHGFGSTLIEKSLAAHGGEACIHYRADGVACDIRLPLAERPQPHGGGPMTLSQTRAASDPAAARFDDLRGKRILLVEDEPLIAMDVIATLSEAGCDVVGPATTLATAKARIAAADFDVALLDANLGGQPVDELAAALTRLNIPFAFLTGYGRDGLPEAFRQAPMISKPFTRDHAYGVVGQLLRQGEKVVPLRQQST